MILRFAVHTDTKPKFIKVCEIAKKMGFSWLIKGKIDEGKIWESHGENTCVFLGQYEDLFSDSSISYSSRNFYEKYHTHIISYEKFMEWFVKGEIK